MLTYCVDREIARLVTMTRPLVGTPLWRDFKADVRAWAHWQLARRPGYFLLSGLDQLSEGEARRFVLRVSTMLGDPLSQDSGGQPVRDVVDRGPRLDAASTVRYSDTRHGGNLHTDGCHRLGDVPDVFTLYCVRQASSGGALVLIHVSDLLDALSDQPEVLDALRMPVHFDTRDDRTAEVPRTVQRPVLEIADGATRIHYLREYIDSAYRRADLAPLSAHQAGALDALDALLDRRDLQSRVRLKPGEMIVVNNRSVVHGRTQFSAESGGGGRLLLRVWIAMSGGLFRGPVAGRVCSAGSDGHDVGVRR